MKENNQNSNILTFIENEDPEFHKKVTDFSDGDPLPEDKYHLIIFFLMESSYSKEKGLRYRLKYRADEKKESIYYQLLDHVEIKKWRQANDGDSLAKIIHFLQLSGLKPDEIWRKFYSVGVGNGIKHNLALELENAYYQGELDRDKVNTLFNYHPQLEEEDDDLGNYSNSNRLNFDDSDIGNPSADNDDKKYYQQPAGEIEYDERPLDQLLRDNRLTTEEIYSTIALAIEKHSNSENKNLDNKNEQIEFFSNKNKNPGELYRYIEAVHKTGIFVYSGVRDNIYWRFDSNSISTNLDAKESLGLGNDFKEKDRVELQLESPSNEDSASENEDGQPLLIPEQNNKNGNDPGSSHDDLDPSQQQSTAGQKFRAFADLGSMSDNGLLSNQLINIFGGRVRNYYYNLSKQKDIQPGKLKPLEINLSFLMVKKIRAMQHVELLVNDFSLSDYQQFDEYDQTEVNKKREKINDHIECAIHELHALIPSDQVLNDPILSDVRKLEIKSINETIEKLKELKKDLLCLLPLEEEHSNLLGRRYEFNDLLEEKLSNIYLNSLLEYYKRQQVVIGERQSSLVRNGSASNTYNAALRAINDHLIYEGKEIHNTARLDDFANEAVRQSESSQAITVDMQHREPKLGENTIFLSQRNVKQPEQALFSALLIEKSNFLEKAAHPSGLLSHTPLVDAENLKLLGIHHQRYTAEAKRQSQLAKSSNNSGHYLGYTSQWWSHLKRTFSDQQLLNENEIAKLFDTTIPQASDNLPSSDQDNQRFSIPIEENPEESLTLTTDDKNNANNKIKENHSKQKSGSISNDDDNDKKYNDDEEALDNTDNDIFDLLIKNKKYNHHQVTNKSFRAMLASISGLMDVSSPRSFGLPQEDEVLNPVAVRKVVGPQHSGDFLLAFEQFWGRFFKYFDDLNRRHVMTMMLFFSTLYMQFGFMGLHMVLQSNNLLTNLVYRISQFISRLENVALKELSNDGIVLLQEVAKTGLFRHPALKPLDVNFAHFVSLVDKALLHFTHADSAFESLVVCGFIPVKIVHTVADFIFANVADDQDFGQDNVDFMLDQFAEKHLEGFSGSEKTANFIHCIAKFSVQATVAMLLAMGAHIAALSKIAILNHVAASVKFFIDMDPKTILHPDYTTIGAIKTTSVIYAKLMAVRHIIARDLPKKRVAADEDQPPLAEVPSAEFLENLGLLTRYLCQHVLEQESELQLGHHANEVINQFNNSSCGFVEELNQYLGKYEQLQTFFSSLPKAAKSNLTEIGVKEQYLYSQQPELQLAINAGDKSSAAANIGVTSEEETKKDLCLLVEEDALQNEIEPLKENNSIVKYQGSLMASLLGQQLLPLLMQEGNEKLKNSMGKDIGWQSEKELGILATVVKLVEDDATRKAFMGRAYPGSKTKRAFVERTVEYKLLREFEAMYGLNPKLAAVFDQHLLKLKELEVKKIYHNRFYQFASLVGSIFYGTGAVVVASLEAVFSFLDCCVYDFAYLLMGEIERKGINPFKFCNDLISGDPNRLPRFLRIFGGQVGSQIVVGSILKSLKMLVLGILAGPVLLFAKNGGPDWAHNALNVWSSWFTEGLTILSKMTSAVVRSFITVGIFRVFDLLTVGIIDYALSPINLVGATIAFPLAVAAATVLSLVVAPIAWVLDKLCHATSHDNDARMPYQKLHNKVLSLAKWCFAAAYKVFQFGSKCSVVNLFYRGAQAYKRNENYFSEKITSASPDLLHHIHRGILKAEYGSDRIEESWYKHSIYKHQRYVQSPSKQRADARMRGIDATTRLACAGVAALFIVKGIALVIITVASFHLPLLPVLAVAAVFLLPWLRKKLFSPNRDRNKQRKEIQKAHLGNNKFRIVNNKNANGSSQDKKNIPNQNKEENKEEKRQDNFDANNTSLSIVSSSA